MVVFLITVCAYLGSFSAQAGVFDKNKPTVVIIDGFSTGRFYPLASDRFNFINVASPEWPGDSVFKAAHENYTHTTTYGPITISMIHSLAPVAILAGSELGVPTSHEILASFPNLPQNKPELAEARWDKFLMQQSLGNPIPGIVTADWAEASKWLGHFFSEQPEGKVFVKPRRDSGGVGGGDFDQEDFAKGLIEAHFRRVLSAPDSHGRPHEGLYLMEFIEGPEFVIDSVTVDPTLFPGRHLPVSEVTDFTTDILRYHRVPNPGHGDNYHIDSLLAPEGHFMERLKAFRSQVLRNLGYRIGLSHMEVKYDEARDQFFLMEVGERAAGGDIPLVVEQATGLNPLALDLISRTEPEALFTIFEGRDYLLRRNAMIYNFNATIPGIVHQSFFEDVLRLLVSDWKMARPNLDGDYQFVPTVDLDTVPGYILLAGTKQQLIRDRLTLERIDTQVFNPSFYRTCDDLFTHDGKEPNIKIDPTKMPT